MTSCSTAQSSAQPKRRPKNPALRVLDAIGSIPFGIALLVLLFIYSAIGSAGVPRHLMIWEKDAWVPVRQLPGLEMTEYEWFQWWPFPLMIGLICIALVIATLRRIPFKPVNFGVWTIHTGLIVLSIGSVWYFGTKIEGDVPIARRRVEIVMPTGETTSLAAMPGQIATASKDGKNYTFAIIEIEPEWEILSGEDAGVRAFAVNVQVQTPDKQFIRKLIAGYPQYTEDVIFTGNASQPFMRAITELGTPLVDESLELRLVPDKQDVFYVMHSSALYTRLLDEANQPMGPWVERPIEGLPRYYEYLDDVQTIWPVLGDGPKPRTLDLTVDPIEAGGEAGLIPIQVTGYLPYAFSQTRFLPGGTLLNPYAKLEMSAPDGQSGQFELFAYQPDRNREESSGQVVDDSVIEFKWARTALERAAYLDAPSARLQIRVPGDEVEVTEPIVETSRQTPDLAFTKIQGTPYAFRVSGFENNLSIGGTKVSVAMVDIKKGEAVFRRWVFDQPQNNRDLELSETDDMAGQERPLDTGIEMVYLPATTTANSPAIVLVGGPEDTVPMVQSQIGSMAKAMELMPNQPVDVGRGVLLQLTQYIPKPRMITKPVVVPPQQRQRDADGRMRMMRVNLSAAEGDGGVWLPFHPYPFESNRDVLLRFPYDPTMVTLADGRRLEILYSRRTSKLPTPVWLEDFKLTPRPGGFTGTTQSVRNWTSVVAFDDGNGGSTVQSVSVNDPQESGGYWFFQAQWDPPQESLGDQFAGSRGLNYTVLGVGNRAGVIVQLVGCCLTVLGMIYAFYVKPIIKRRKQSSVRAKVASGGAA